MKVNIWTNIIHLLMGGTCPLCGVATPASDLCLSCDRDIPNTTDICRHCALPLPANTDPLICGQCQQHPPPFQTAYSFTRYAPPVDRMLQQLKFQRKLNYAKLLGQRMALDIVARQLAKPDVIVPVPLHEQRMRQRGYNQALELARPIARQLITPLEINACHRPKATQEQTGLAARQRRANVKQAFKVDDKIKHLHVAIVDDVMTTGSTVTELSKQLLQAGARRVDVWVCARASLKR
jgi:ComF family protein